jgi:hypothetical protein
MALNPNQVRAVTVTLRLLEERLADVERVIAADERGILYERVASFTPAQRAQMNESIRALREQIRRAAEEFHLPRETQSAARYVVGTVSLLWESVEEIRARKLKSYGEVDPQLKQTLDPILQRIVRLLFDLMDAARGEASTTNDFEI